jgi:hypothetical protein
MTTNGALLAMIGITRTSFTHTLVVMQRQGLNMSWQTREHKMSKAVITASAKKAWQASTEASLTGVTYTEWLEHQKAVLGLYWGSE